MSVDNVSKIWIITLFPEYFQPLTEVGVAGQALQGNRGRDFELKIIQLRDFSFSKYKGVDDTPYGGGPGMVMKADVLENALIKGIVEAGAYGEEWRDKLHVVYTSPRGKKWDNDLCKEFASRVWDVENGKDLVFICGRYEGIDERFISQYVNELLSLGDFVLTGGEPAVLTILDSALRFVPGTLGNKESAEDESFQSDLIEHPQYTRPFEFNGEKVPEVLVSGHHAKIEKYQLDQRIEITKQHRPDLYDKYLNRKDK